MYISVVGASSCDSKVAKIAEEIGRQIARRGHILVCGGLGGVMDAAAKGASEEGGISIGILPHPDRRLASKWLTVSVPTDLGHARNTLVALSGDAVIAVSGGYGTLSEIALALKMGKPVVGVNTWNFDFEGREEKGIIPASTPAEAVDFAERQARACIDEGFHDAT